jgi:hypothetical protein
MPTLINNFDDGQFFYVIVMGEYKEDITFFLSEFATHTARLCGSSRFRYSCSLTVNKRTAAFEETAEQ